MESDAPTLTTPLSVLSVKRVASRRANEANSGQVVESCGSDVWSVP